MIRVIWNETSSETLPDLKKTPKLPGTMHFSVRSGIFAFSYISGIPPIFDRYAADMKVDIFNLKMIYFRWACLRYRLRLCFMDSK